MVSILLLVLILAACYGAWRLGGRLTRQDYAGGRLWQLAGVIGVVRIAALWLGAAGLRSSGPAQVWGYELLMIDLPEIYLAKSLRGQPFAWAVIASAVLAATSFIWASILIWIGARLRPAAPTPG